MKTLKEVRENVHNKLLLIRNIYTTVNLERFNEAYKYASKEQQDKILEFILLLDQRNLLELIEEIIFESAELETLSVRDLRIIAQKCRVQDYHFLPKASLISEIKRYEQSYKIIRRNGSAFIEIRNKANAAN